jgi:hypothetical protein
MVTRDNIITSLLPYFNDPRYYLLVLDMGFGKVDELKEKYPNSIFFCDRECENRFTFGQPFWKIRKDNWEFLSVSEDMIYSLFYLKGVNPVEEIIAVAIYEIENK